MAKGALTEVNKTERQVRKKVRKTLRTLQVSDNNQILTESNFMQPDGKTLLSKKRLPKDVEKVVVDDKENTPILRRSKRKIAVEAKSDTLLVKPKTKISSAKNVLSHKRKLKKTAVETLKECSPPVMNEDEVSRNFIPLTPVAEDQDISESTNPDKNLIIPSEVTEDSGFESSTRVSDQCLAQSVTVPYSSVLKNYSDVDYDASILTCEIAPLSYWMDLAEQRRIALENALQENELLHDQLAVLEAENSQLKQIVRQAEEVAELVKGIIK